MMERCLQVQNPSFYVIKEKMERMMKEIQDGIVARQHEMLNGFFRRMDQQRTIRAAGIQNQKPKTNVGASGVGAKQNTTEPHSQTSQYQHELCRY